MTLAMPHTKLCSMNEVSSLQVLSEARGLKFSNLCSLLLKKNSSGGGRRAHGEEENLICYTFRICILERHEYTTLRTLSFSVLAVNSIQRFAKKAEMWIYI